MTEFASYGMGAQDLNLVDLEPLNRAQLSGSTMRHGTIPLNGATLTWEPGAPPQNWKAQVDRVFPHRWVLGGCHGDCLFLDGVSSPLIFSVLTLLPEPQISAAEATNCPFSTLG